MKKILVIDDDELIRKNLTENLSADGHRVVCAVNGQDAFDKLKAFRADLVILDLEMPVMNGFEFLQTFRKRPEYNVVPVIVLSGKNTPAEIVRALKLGAANYILKPSAPSVISRHIQTTFEITSKYADLNPLTGLPGNHVIALQVNQKLSKNDKFAFCYADLDNFKAYNDFYGFEKGDKVLLYTADILRKTLGILEDTFIGNIGGDDFVIIMPIDNFEKHLKSFIKAFDSGIKAFYETKDYMAGAISVMNRDGQIKEFPIISVSIGIVPSTTNTYYSILDISDAAVEVKKKAKSLTGSHYYIDQRGETVVGDRFAATRILINEYASYNVRIIKHLLEPMGFRFINAADNGAILETTIKHEPQVVIVELSKAETAKIVPMIRNHEKQFKMKHCYIILVFSEISQRDVIAFMKQGIDGIIVPPINKEQIINKIKSFLG